MAPLPAIFPILSTVVTNMRATTGYNAPTSGRGIPVFDGPIAGSNDNPATYVCVGWTRNGDTAGTLHTSAAVFGARADRLEEGTFEVTCVASSGDLDASPVRTTLRQVVADLTAAVYGLTDASFAAYWAELSNFDLVQYQSPSGVTVEAICTFSYRVQLGA